MYKCNICEDYVDEDRAEFLMETKRKITCMDCSTEQRATGFMSYEHKTAPQLVILPEDPEVKRIAKRAFVRAR